MVLTKTNTRIREQIMYYMFNGREKNNNPYIIMHHFLNDAVVMSKGAMIRLD